jgi:hypothetical protein
MERVSHSSHLAVVNNDKKIILHLCLRAAVPEVYRHKGKVIVINVCIFTSLTV